MSVATVDVISLGGGVNRTFDPESVRQNEVKICQNGRDHIHGAIQKRAGTQRIHDTVLPGPVKGLFQWDAPGSPRQVVAVANGSFYHQHEGDTDFTLTASGLSVAQRTQFAVHHEEGTPVLYLTDGVTFYKWDGSTLSPVTGAPTMTGLRVYKSRMFSHEDTTLRYSAVDEPEEYSQVQGAGSAKIQTYDTEAIQAIRVLSDALVVFKANSVSRFTMYAIEVPEIDTGTDGIASDVGLIAQDGVAVYQNQALMVSDRGPYVVTAGGVSDIGFKIDNDFVSTSDALAVHNRNRSEVWVFTDADTCWVWNYQTQTWWGEWNFSFSVSAACRGENPDGSETVLLGGSDGWIRNGDASVTRDDVLRNGTGGDRIEMVIEFPEQYFGSRNAYKSGAQHQFIRADLGVSGAMALEVESEDGRWGTTVASYGPNEEPYRLRPYFRGRGITFRIRENGPDTTTIYSATFVADVLKEI